MTVSVGFCSPPSRSRSAVQPQGHSDPSRLYQNLPYTASYSHPTQPSTTAHIYHIVLQIFSTTAFYHILPQIYPLHSSPQPSTTAHIYHTALQMFTTTAFYHILPQIHPPPHSPPQPSTTAYIYHTVLQMSTTTVISTTHFLKAMSHHTVHHSLLPQPISTTLLFKCSLPQSPTPHTSSKSFTTQSTTPFHHDPYLPHILLKTSLISTTYSLKAIHHHSFPPHHTTSYNLDLRHALSFTYF
ncbi:hypothetical protein E2C01_006866 [Portunus trituberculatus]|uniref:Uncharacterized protein n=1 Tax=Portunus trituberculatus TaxID=210409 RepID=A0A5B7D2Z0_PORTR|nr:hypothetical protein [Portunus trituberculatus]